MEVDWGGRIEANHTSGCMLSEVDWEAHDSSLFLYLEQIDHDGEPHKSSLFNYLQQIDHDGEPQDFFPSGSWRGLLQGKFSTSQLWGGPSKGNFFQPQEFMSIMWLLLLKALQRLFKTLIPYSKISNGENNFWKVCHHYSSCECQPRSTGNWHGGNCCPSSSHCFPGEERWTRPESSQGGVIKFQPTIHLVIHLGAQEILAWLDHWLNLVHHELSTKNRLKKRFMLMLT